jgi:hypothetical protein
MGKLIFSRAARVSLFALSVFLLTPLLIPAEAQSYQNIIVIKNGTNIVGLPGVSTSDFAACNLKYYDSRSNPGCSYRDNGYFVYYDAANSSGDCGNNFFSSASMSDGRGYYISASSDCTVQYTMKNIIDVTLYSGTNIIIVPTKTSTDQIASVCGAGKDVIFKSYDSKSKPGCVYNQTGYVVYYNSTNASGDCDSNFHSSSTLLPNVGYYVSFNGQGGDGKSSCTLRYVNGILQASSVSTTTTTSPTTSTTTSGSTTSVTTKTTTTAITSGKVWNVWKTGGVYYGTGVQSSPSFPVVWKEIHALLSAGDTVHFAGSTEYVSNETITLTKSGIALTGDLGPGGRPTAFIRSYSSTQGVVLFEFKGDNTKLLGIGFSGLGYVDNLDQMDPYDLVHFGGADNAIIENCTFEHFHQYILELSESSNFTIRYNTIRYGQNGIATYSTNNGGVIEYNDISDCSQGAIKIRGGHGTSVRYNTIHLEYTYWRSFDHHNFPGTDGRGIELHDAYASSQGIYFGVTDPQPDYNVNVYGNTIIDTSVHGTIQIKDVVDGTLRKSPPESFGCRFPLDANTADKSQNNLFHGNYVNGAYYGVWVENYAVRTPQPIIVYENNTFINILQNSCYFTKAPTAAATTDMVLDMENDEDVSVGSGMTWDYASVTYYPNLVTVSQSSSHAHGGTYGMKLTVNSATDQGRRNEVLHLWDSEQITKMTTETWVYLPSNFVPGSFNALIRPLYERYWGDSNRGEVGYMWYNGATFGIFGFDGRSSRPTYGQPLIEIYMNHGDVEAAHPLPVAYDLYLSDMQQANNPSTGKFDWIEPFKSHPEQRWTVDNIKGKWIKVTCKVTRNLSNWDDGRIEWHVAFPMDGYADHLLYMPVSGSDEHGWNPSTQIRTVGISPLLLAQRQSESWGQAPFCSGVSNYNGIGDANNDIYFDDIILSAS